MFASEPVAVFEVLSKTTEWFDRNLKLRDYDAVPSIRFYALISREPPKVMIYRRDQTGQFSPRTMHVLEGLDASIDLAEFTEVPLSELYEDIEFSQ